MHKALNQKLTCLCWDLSYTHFSTLRAFFRTFHILLVTTQIRIIFMSWPISVPTVEIMETRAVSIIMRQLITCPAPVITTQLVSVMRAVTIKLFSRFCCNEYSVNRVRLVKMQSNFALPYFGRLGIKLILVCHFCFICGMVLALNQSNPTGIGLNVEIDCLIVFRRWVT